MMTSLYCLLLAALLISLGMLALPVYKHRILWKKYALLSGLFITLTCSIYFISGNKEALRYWMMQGKQHYQLQEEVIALGGVNKIIEKIKLRLANNPQDIQGWIVLAKLYISLHDTTAAREALKKAAAIDSQNPEVKKLLIQLPT